MKKLIAVALVGILIGFGLAWVFRRSPGLDPPSRSYAASLSRSAPVQSPPASANPGSLSLDPEAITRMGVEVRTIKLAWHAPRTRAMAVVLSPTGLAQIASAYSTDAKDLAVAQASLVVAQDEYRRQSTLYRADQTTSLKAFQSAQGTFASAEAQATAAHRLLQLDALAARQHWGPTVGKWLVSRQPALERVLSQQAWLVDVTLASGYARDVRWGPPVVRFVAPTGGGISGTLVSSLPQTNPIVQGLNFLYLIPARPGFAPGLSLEAELPAGPVRRGVVIPASAVVWSSNAAWAYKEISPGHFQRVRVSTAEPIAAGWFVTTGFAPGDRVVTRGAEELFSAESTPTGGAGESGSDD